MYARCADIYAGPFAALMRWACRVRAALLAAGPQVIIPMKHIYIEWHPLVRHLRNISGAMTCGKNIYFLYRCSQLSGDISFLAGTCFGKLPNFLVFFLS